MATQKAALVGCKEGPWISTSTMRNLRLHVKGEQALKVEVCQRFHDEEVKTSFSGPGVHSLMDLLWAKVRVIEGNPASALCFLVSGNG